MASLVPTIFASEDWIAWNGLHASKTAQVDGCGYSRWGTKQGKLGVGGEGLVCT